MLFVTKDELPIGKFDMGHTSFDTTIVYGTNSSLMEATRPAGYHSKPHVHDCEQINYVLDGEVILFVGEKGRHLKKGDISRTPANALHWCWNQSDKPMVLLEVHSPGLQNDPKCEDYAFSLADEGEDLKLMDKPLNIFPEYTAEVEEIIRKAEAPFMK